MTAVPTTRARPRWRRPALAAAACGVLAACAAIPAPGDAVTFVVVRHAEKVDGSGNDPGLSGQGAARARALAADLRRAPLVAAYATGYRRTRETAAPSARMHGLEVATYDAKSDAQAFARQLRLAHAGGMVLVVGHSNTVTDIASALCACPVAPIDDSVYGGRYDIAVGSDGRATLALGRF